MSKSDPKEKRRVRRRLIQSTFSLFLVIPKKGPYRLGIRDLSEIGIGFDADVEGESAADFPIRAGDVLEARLYLNQSLYLPLSIRVARLEEKQGIRCIGGDLSDCSAGEKRALAAFVQMMDEVAEIAKIESPVA